MVSWTCRSGVAAPLSAAAAAVELARLFGLLLWAFAGVLVLFKRLLFFFYLFLLTNGADDLSHHELIALVGRSAELVAAAPLALPLLRCTRRPGLGRRP